MNRKRDIELKRELARLEGEQRSVWTSGNLDDPQGRALRQQKILQLQREVYASESREFAEPLDLGIPIGGRWRVLADWNSLILRVDLDVVVNGSSMASLKFVDYQAAKLELLNDEVFDAHPLFGAGLDIVGAFVVRNSRWLASLRAVLATHHGFNDETWVVMRHFLFREKPGDFHCIASGVVVELADNEG